VVEIELSPAGMRLRTAAAAAPQLCAASIDNSPFFFT
jgi:hypothetical protein